MKIIKIFGLLFFAMFAFNSCSLYDEDNEVIDLTGTKWETTYYRYEITGTNYYDEFEIEGDLSSSEYYNTLSFKTDGTFTKKTYDNQVLNGSWFQYDTVIVIVIDSDNGTYNISYIISGNKLESSSSYYYTNSYTKEQSYKYEQIKE